MCHTLQATRQSGCTCCRSLGVGEAIDVEEQAVEEQRTNSMNLQKATPGLRIHSVTCSLCARLDSQEQTERTLNITVEVNEVC